MILTYLQDATFGLDGWTSAQSYIVVELKTKTREHQWSATSSAHNTEVLSVLSTAPSEKCEPRCTSGNRAPAC